MAFHGKKDIDWEMFEKLVWVPILTNDHLADMLGVSTRTLERQVREKYDDSVDSIRTQKQGPMRHKLFTKMWETAMAGSPACIIWLTKNLFGWYDKVESKSQLSLGVDDVKKEIVLRNLKDVKDLK